MLTHTPVASAPVAHARPHPRRCAARDSLSAPRKRQKLNHHSDDSGSIAGVAGAPLASQPASRRQTSSQESEGNLNASRWFDSANSNIGHALHDLAGYDNEPPFFISQNNASGCFATIEHGLADDKPFGGYSQQDSEKEDLRDVIDDLTIENKRLKQLLRNRKVRQDAQDSDKLFEIRVHGLASEQKRELEELLRSFASNLAVNAGAPSRAAKPSLGSHRNGAPPQARQTDSGYASNSNSGQTSATPSHPGRPAVAVSRKSNEKTVKSYLHNIPVGLLPRQSLVMSERAKMSLVVRRLENLFTGKQAAPGEHSQPLQQQEVSRLAADADRQRATIHRRPEGSREAHILPFDSEVNVEGLHRTESSSSDGKARLVSTSAGSGKSTPEAVESGSSASRSPDQRPTRPLDLDVHRAQVAEENIEYLRHLGLTSPKLHADPDKEDGEGWIYLNLLTSMAQLHTINVTPAFIKKSIQKVSAKFELSGDGNKVRWKQGRDARDRPAATVQDSEVMDGQSVHHVIGRGTDQPLRGMARSNTQTSATPSEDRSSNRLTSQSSMRVQPFSVTPKLITSFSTSRSRPASSFDYRPILFGGQSSSRPMLSHREPSSVFHSPLDNWSLADSNETSDGLAEHASPGPIVFYSSPLFCSDFSGEQVPTNLRQPSLETSTVALGGSAVAPLDETRDREGSYFAQNPVAPISEQWFDVPTGDLTPIVGSCHAEPWLLELPASGIGGVTPQDHFVIDVEIARIPRAARDGEKADVGERGGRSFGYRVTGCARTSLPPSPLPPPSYIFLPFASSSSSAVDDAWGSDDEAADTSIDEQDLVPLAYLAKFSTEDSSLNDGAEEMDTDTSIDMLATARAMDPATIAAREREFEVTSKAMQMDEDAVAESLVATAGGGSEFDSGVESDVDDASSDTDTDDDL